MGNVRKKLVIIVRVLRSLTDTDTQTDHATVKLALAGASDGASIPWDALHMCHIPYTRNK